MLKASALYLVIIVALVIGLLCSALIATAYFYKLTYQMKSRYDQMENNLNSGVNILTASEDTAFIKPQNLDLFGNGNDSVKLERTFWGLFDVCTSKAFIQKDTLFKVFSLARTVDSNKWAALYLIDEDRLLSVSGKTTILGDAYLPKAGVKEAYVDNKAYSGDKKLIIGRQLHSNKALPILDTTRLKQMSAFKENLSQKILPNQDSVFQSFKRRTLFFNFKKVPQTLQNITLSGNIVLVSDTTITIDSTAHLNNIIVYARSVSVQTGFHGSCQVYATDTIGIQKDCTFDYPSAIGVFRFKTTKIAERVKISIGDHTTVNGLIFTYEKDDNKVKPLIQLGKVVTVRGQIYSQDAVELTDNDEIDGSVFTSRFLYKSNFTVFENYLINVKIDSKALSPYYLTSSLVPVASKKRKVLQWLEQN